MKQGEIRRNKLNTNRTTREMAVFTLAIANLTTCAARIETAVAEACIKYTFETHTPPERAKIIKEIDTFSDLAMKLLIKLGILIAKLEKEDDFHVGNLSNFTTRSLAEEHVLAIIREYGPRESLCFIHSLIGESRRKAMEMTKKIDNHETLLIVSENFALQSIWLAVQTHFLAVRRILHHS